MKAGEKANTIIAVVSVVLVLSLIAVHGYALDSTGNTLRAQALDMLRQTESSDWARLSECYEQTKGYWREVRSLWLAFVPRGSIDEIEMEQARLQQAIAGEDMNGTRAALGELIEELEQIIGRVAFDWVNIL